MFDVCCIVFEVDRVVVVCCVVECCCVRVLIKCDLMMCVVILQIVLYCVLVDFDLVEGLMCIIDFFLVFFVIGVGKCDCVLEELYIFLVKCFGGLGVCQCCVFEEWFDR